MAASVLVAAGSAHAQVNVLPRELEGVDVTEHMMAQVPRDAVLRDHEGNMVRMDQLLGHDRPVILNFVYYRCPMLCSMVFNALMSSLRQVDLTVGERFDVITVSIDPLDRPADAAAKRTRALREYGRAPAAQGWHFLVGDEPTVRRLADAVGFQYRYDARQAQYAHPASILVLTPEGRVARYLYGLEFPSRDVRLGLLEAAGGRAITTTDRFLLFCYHYDPQGKKYALAAMRVMRAGGAVTALALAGMLGLFWTRERLREPRSPLPPPPGADASRDPEPVRS